MIERHKKGEKGSRGADVMAEMFAQLVDAMTVDPDKEPQDGKKTLINDPACGTGRMLLAASDVNPRAELVGVDVDARCGKITAVNLGLP